MYDSDGSAHNVDKLIGHSSDGDTVTIPSGTFTWNNTVTIPNTKAITLQGKGVGKTIVKDAVQRGPFLVVNVRSDNKTKLTRITGIEFQDGGRAIPANGRNGVIRFNGRDNRTDGRLRFDHCKWFQLKGPLLANTVLGVFDHLDVTCQPKQGPWSYLHHEFWNGGRESDKSFSDPITWGDANWLFIEDCTFGGSKRGIEDAYKGARLVIRHNILKDMSIQSHGTESGGGRARGVAAIDCYNNEFIGTSGKNGVVAFLRSGTHRFHDNTTTNWSDPKIVLSCYRLFWDFARSGLGGADGRNPLDVNKAGGPFYKGTASTGSQLSVSVSGDPWTSDQWKGYSIVKTSGLLAGQQKFSLIVGNTSNTISYLPAFQPRGTMTFSPGDRFELYKVLQALDQPGRIGGTISGNPPRFSRGTNDQTTDPVYEWNNHSTELDGSDYKYYWKVGNNRDAPIRENEHYFTDHRPPPSGYSTYTYPHPLTKSGGQ